MTRHAVPPRVEAARRLPWQVELDTPASGLRNALNLLLEHCRRTNDPDAWYWPRPGAVWCFAERQAAESFAAHAHQLTGRVAPVRDSRSFVITHRLKLEDAPAAYKTYKEKQDGCIKVILTP